jgi:glycosyltransferase involved in cell wall biosynthesis
MRIAFYSDTVFTFGGVQRVLAEVAKGLAERHEVTILSLDRTADLQMYGYAQSGVRFVYLNYPKAEGPAQWIRKAYSLCYKRLLTHGRLTSALYARSFFPEPYKRQLAEAINRGGYDAVIGVHAFLSMHLASIRPRIHARTIGWMHNSYEAFFEKEHPYVPYLKDFFAYCMQRMDDCVVLCQADAMRYRAELGLQPKVIYNPLTLHPTADATSPGGTIHHRILSVGRFSYRHKGFDILLKAFALLAKTHPEWTLELVGEGPERPLYDQIIQKEGIEGKVEIQPFTTQIGEHYRAADFYVLSSRWEGLPLVLMEAMAHGLPVVASRLPVTEELLEGHDEAILFERENAEALAEAMERMIAGNHWLTLKEKAKRYAALFTIENKVKEWESLLAPKGELP